MKIGKIIFLISLILALFFFTKTVIGQTSDSSSNDQLKHIQDQIKEVQGKIDNLESQGKTLSSQIAVIDNQIRLTELKIEANKQEISNLTLDIDTATKKISTLSESLNILTGVLLNRIVATYEVGSQQPFEILLSSSSVSSFFSRLNYLKIAQVHDKKLVYQTQQAKNDYVNQKNIFEDKKKRVIFLKNQLEDYTNQLAKDRQGKQDLLSITKNDEANFQDLLARLKADAESIGKALGNIGYKIGHVSKGDIIASVGSSGCSTGPHLHFEIFKDARVEEGKIIGTRVDPKPYLDDSKYEKPVPNYPENVTTWYGQVYFLGVHTGIDIANYYGTPIRAIDNGEAYFTSAPCGYNIAGGSSLGKGIVIDHANGLVSLYWHIP